MNITDELRGYAGNFYLFRYKDVREKLDAIADRIDAVHAGLERENRSLREELDRFHGELDDLPLDVDGRQICIGDTMAMCDDPTLVARVEGVGDGCFFAWNEDAGRYQMLDASLSAHWRRPTVEDVLREFVSEFNRDDTELCDEEIIERFAAKLRLADDGKEQ